MSYVIISILLLELTCSIHAQHNPNFKYPRRGIVQLFEWKFVDIAHECESFLGKNNFGGVLVSPVNENIIIKNRPWWERYQSMSFKILTRSGNSEEFLDMTKRCNDVGVRIYIDISINHMAAPQDEMIGTAGSTATYRNYPSAAFLPEDFHWPCHIESYFDAHQVRNCELLHMPDLDHASPVVRGKIVAFMNYLIDLGVGGFRMSGEELFKSIFEKAHFLNLTACKHMWPNDLQEIYKELNNLREDFDFEPNARPFIMQEVLDFGGEPISKTEYTSFGVVTEFMYAKEISRIFRGESNLSELIKLGPELGFLRSDDSLVFVDDVPAYNFVRHDTQRGFSVKESMSISYKSRKKYIMANAFMAAYPYGTIRMMSSYDFSITDIDKGPPMDENEKIISVTSDDSGACLNGWICEHRWMEIVEMIKFRVNVFGTSITKWTTFEPNTVGFCRENKGFIIFSSSNFECLVDKRIFVCVKPGRYCDVMSGYDQNGNCLNIIQVDKKRYATVINENVERHDVIAFHVGSQIE